MDKMLPLTLLYAAYLLLVYGVQAIQMQGAQPTVGEPSPLFDYKTGRSESAEDVEDLQIDMNFTFMATQHEKVYITRDGAITFSLKPVRVYSYDQLPHEHPLRHDPPMAAVFFATSSDGMHQDDHLHPELASKIYYQTLLSTDADTTLLEELSRQVRINAVTDMADFKPMHALLVTWLNLRPECESGACTRNTFQAALVTDGEWTYAIYNYEQLEWLGSGANCDEETGSGVTCFKAQVGFNAGYGRRFEPIPGSSLESARDLVTLQGSKVKGRHIYRVSHNKVLRDACTNGGPMEPMPVYPESAVMFGGTEVYVAGPCLPETKPFPKVTCSVSYPNRGNMIEFHGRVVDSGRIACVIPPVTSIGDMTLRVKEASNTQYHHETSINIELPRHKLLPVRLHSYSATWLQQDAAELSLSWRPEVLNGGWLDMSSSDNATGMASGVEKVDILLYGLTAFVPNNANSPLQWTLLKHLGNGLANSGSFSFKPTDQRCVHNCYWDIGLIKIVPLAPAADITNIRGIYSDVFPLGWFVEEYMTKEHGEKWPEYLCQKFTTRRDMNPEWQKDLLPCPCTAAQAYTDTARFMVGSECDDTNTTGPVPCPLVPEAAVCYVSTTPTGVGAQTRCCYKPNGLLISSADGPNGSYSAKAHEQGHYPYNHYLAVPVLSNWLEDKLPHIWCCVWSTDPSQCLVHYEPLRRTPECSRHLAPGTAYAFGDPHFMTFDGNSYTFNGYSEYWLLHVDELLGGNNFQLQVRMQSNDKDEYQLDISEKAMKATIITAVAMQQGSGSNEDAPWVNFFLNLTKGLNRISVYVGSVMQDFSTVHTRSFRARKHSITIKRHGSGITHSNFTVVTDTGVSVTVAENAGLLQVSATVPPSYLKKTKGLFGYWDGNKTNDLLMKDGKAIVNPGNTKDVHDRFGVDWLVKTDESIFKYFGVMDWNSFHDTSFIPNFEPTFPNVTHGITENMVENTCKGNLFCTFDYMTTLRASIAEASLQTEQWATQTKAMSTQVEACEYLQIARSLRDPVSSNLLGGQVKLTGCLEEYTLQGPRTFECIKDGESVTWSEKPGDTQCKANYKIAAEKQQLAVAISVPIALIVLALLVAILVFLMLRKRQKGSRGMPPPEKDVYVVPDNQFPSETQPTIPSMYAAGKSISLSKTSVNSKASQNSIVLTELLVAQRPQRPLSKAQQQQQQAAPKVIYPALPSVLTDNPVFDSGLPPTPNPRSSVHDDQEDYVPYNPSAGDQGQSGGEYDKDAQDITSTQRPVSTLSFLGDESRPNEDVDARPLNGQEAVYSRATPRGYRPGGYDNQAAAGLGEESRIGMQSAGRFGYQPPVYGTRKPDTFV